MRAERSSSEHKRAGRALRKIEEGFHAASSPLALVGPGECCDSQTPRIRVAHHLIRPLLRSHSPPVKAIAPVSRCAVQSSFITQRFVTAAFKWILLIDLNHRIFLHMPPALPTSRDCNHTLPICPEAYLHRDSATNTLTVEIDLGPLSEITNLRTEAHQLRYQHSHSCNQTNSTRTTCPTHDE